MTEALDGQVNLFDLGIWSGKMCQAHSAATSRMDSEISEPCWKKLYASQNRDFLFLDCRTSRSGRKPEECSATDGASHGERTTPNTGEFPSADGVSAWWSILTDTPQGKTVLCVETGEVFASAHEAARRTGINRGNIGSACLCRPKHNTAGGYHWRYLGGNSDDR